MDTPAPETIAELRAELRAGRFAPAAERAAELVRRHPAVAFGHAAAGLAALGLGRGADALAAFDAALALAPGDAQLTCHRGSALRALGRDAEAEAAWQDAIARAPQLVEPHNHLGVLWLAQGRLADAERVLRASLALDAAQPQTLGNLGVVLKNAHRAREAIACYDRALALAPGDADLLGNRGVALLRLARFAEAEASLREAAGHAPRHAAVWNNLGLAVMEQGRIDEAEAIFRHALALEPQRTDARSNLLFALNHTAHADPLQAREEARRFGAVAAAQAKPYSAWRCSADAARLRVGLVSGDLREHPVGYFLEGLVAPLAAEGVELLAYPTHPRLDALGRRLKAGMAAWTPLLGLTDEAAARRIHADAVHVLVDLSGHTAYNRLPLFAWKPAPVQVSWLGYFATTGVAAIDALIADPVSVPPAHEAHFTERIVRLPATRLCFTPPADAPPVAPPPARTRGHVTFGCFQTLGKVGDPVIAAWSAVLARVPGARLRLQCKQLHDATVAAQLRTRLAAAGIDPARVDLHGATPRPAYLAAHAEVDVLLDTFPYPGGTTTCEALWMGVPTVTIAGDRLLARQGASLLGAAGLADWVADDVAGYVDRAVAAAADLDALAELRQRLRAQMAASPLCDAPRFARAFAAALRLLWRGPGG